MNFIDLFCGMGGFSLGFVRAGFEHLFGLDNWKDACDVYEKNIGKAVCANIKDFDGSGYAGKVDIVIGSPPCQTFSVANIKNKQFDSSLVDEFMRVVREIKPKIWVWENVEGAKKIVKEGIAQMFFMQDYGMLQIRKRMFVSNIELKPKKSKKHFLTEKFANQVRCLNRPNRHYLFRTTTTRCMGSGLSGGGDKFNSKIVEGKRLRFLTVEEALQIQSFPFDYKITDRKTVNSTLIGNAVPPLFAYKIACELKKIK